MFIYTHENEIINMDHVEHLYIIEDNDGMFSLNATFTMSYYTTIGSYRTEKEAIKVLNSIYNKIKQRDEIFRLDSTDTYPESK